jgi:hypothetical protein
MPAYEFQTESGTIIEVAFAMKDAPAIGSTYNHPVFGDVVRVPSGTQVSPNFTTSTYPYVSQTLPRNMPGVPADSKGRPIIMSRRHERNVASEHGYIRAED